MFPFKGACPLRIGCNLLEIEKHERSSATESIVCDWAIRAMPNLWAKAYLNLESTMVQGTACIMGNWKE